MLRPMLLVGVGGSGGKTLQLLHRELRYRLRDAGWNHGVPDGWQFLHVDVPVTPDTRMDEFPDAVPVNEPVVGGQYVALAKQAVTYDAIDRTWLRDSPFDALAKVATWRPRPEEVNISIESGAGQFRTIGRVVALSQVALISEAIGRARARLSAPEVQPQLQQLSTMVGQESRAGVDVPPGVLLISSMAGGSGAGMFLDVADIIRASDPAGWCDSSIGVLYTADMFEELPPLGRQGVMPNSLASLCELMNGYWNNRAPGPEYKFFEQAGIPVAGFQRRGIRYPLMVGRANDRVRFPTQNSVYSAMGKTLAAYMTSPSAQTSINAYLTGNWVAASTGLSDATPFKDTSRGTIVSAMGMGSMSLGRDRFGRYSAQRLARAAIEHALRAHAVGKKVPEEITFDTARDDVAVANMQWFVRNCGLDEMGSDHNQVLDQLTPDLAVAADRIRQTIRHTVEQFPSLEPNQYGSVILQQVDATRTAYESATDQLLRDRASEWVRNVTYWVDAAVLEATSRLGLEVTVELLRRLIDHIGDVIGDLAAEIPNLEGHVGQIEMAVRGKLAEFGNQQMLRENELISDAINRALKGLQYGFDARLRRAACELLRDLKENLLSPLHAESGSALGALRIDERPPAGHVGLGVATWPVEGVIPDDLRPALNERLVEGADTFPDSYCVQLTATVRRDDDPNRVLPTLEAETVAVGEILTGRARDLKTRSVLSRDADWWPQFLSSQRPASAARYQLRFRGADILERAEDWIHRRDTAFGDFVHQSLRSYLTVDDAAERLRRRDAVLTAFRESLSVASPLVEFHGNNSREVHGQVPSSQFHFTAVPFAQTDLEAELVAIAEGAGIADEAIERLRGAMNVGDEQRVEMITTLTAPVEPMVLQSVMRPIAEQWSACRDNSAERARFWRWRRARSLPEFVPASPDVQLSMVKGWWVGRIIGALRYDKATFASEPVQIHDNEHGTWRNFPFPYLEAALSFEQELLPAVLESMCVAMLDCQARGSLEPLRAYELLRALGDDATMIMRNWVSHGQTPPGTTPMERAWRGPESTTVSAEASTPSERRDAVRAYISGRRSGYVTRLDAEPVRAATLLVQPRWLDLRDLLDQVFTSLDTDVANAVDGGAGDGGD